MIVSMAMPLFHSAPITALDRPTVEPTDRSTSPETTSIVIGRAMSAIGRVLPMRNETLSALPKLSTNEKEQSSSTISRAPTAVSQRTEPPSGRPGSS